MSNSLNVNDNLNVAGTQTLARDTYRLSIRRAICGIAGLAMATLTFAASVILPAQTTPSARESRVLEASEATPAKDLVAFASITVVGARDPGSRARVRLTGAVQ